MKIAIYSRVVENEQMELLQLFFDTLYSHNITVTIWQAFYQQIQHTIQWQQQPTTYNNASELNEHYEAMVSLGGDGTLLDTVTLVQNKDIAIMGINFGRLGFLASIGKDEIVAAIQALINHTYVTDERTLLHVDSDIPIFGSVPYGLNEFAIHKQDVSPMIKIHTYLNGEFLNTYWADGLIIATPTGSTGYSLSCNGPIVFPDSGSFVITPVAPHNLNLRPIIVPDNTVISFEVEGRTEQYICALDARREIVPLKAQIAIKKEDFGIKLIRLNENNFLQTLRNKLLWGFDKRN